MTDQNPKVSLGTVNVTRSRAQLILLDLVRTGPEFKADVENYGFPQALMLNIRHRISDDYQDSVEEAITKTLKTFGTSTFSVDQKNRFKEDLPLTDEEWDEGLSLVSEYLNLVYTNEPDS